MHGARQPSGMAPEADPASIQSVPGVSAASGFVRVETGAWLPGGPGSPGYTRPTEAPPPGFPEEMDHRMEPMKHPFVVTSVTAGVLGLFYLGLSGWVILRRRSALVGIGDGDDKDLARRIRVHGNFAEYVPFCLVLLALNEAGSPGAPWLVPCAGGLVLGRALHAAGLGRSAGTTVPRFVGTSLTFLVLLALSLGALYLASGAAR